MSKSNNAVKTDLSKMTKAELIAYATEQKEIAEKAKIANARNVDYRNKELSKYFKYENIDDKTYCDFFNHVYEENEEQFISSTYIDKNKNTKHKKFALAIKFLAMLCSDECKFNLTKADQAKAKKHFKAE